jgi:23S rRNA pseudouridine1911/1915/1917 synthase
LKQSPTIISGDPLATDDDAADALALDSETRPLLFGQAQHGMRLDRALAAVVPEFSRSYLRQLIEAGAVQLSAGVARKPAQRVHAGETGHIELRPTPQAQAFVPEAMPIDTVYEDAHLRVIHKPAGLIVHPGAGNWRGTLLNGLLAMDPLAALLPRAGIVHRLDKDTSGLMVVARTRAAMDALVARIAARQVSRQYLALAHRAWQGAPQRHVDAPIGRDVRNRLRMAVVSADAGKPAQTDFTLLENAQAGCLVHCALHTGRTHQIRVHMAHIGHPLVGDAVYGGAPGGGLSRQALHAYRLAFEHPVGNAPLHFHAALPQDIRAAMLAWGLRYNDPHG